MKRNIYYCLIGFFIFNIPGCQDNKNTAKITFIVNTPAPLGDDEKVFIAGNKEELGLWNPAKVELKQKDKTRWEFTGIFNKADILEYKFTKGSWDNEAADSKGSPLQNNVLKVHNDTTVQTDIFFWKNGEEVEVEGKITGTVKYHREINGSGLKERDLIVWLPPQYENNPSHRFPVLYMHDGQNIIDLNTSSFKVDWQLDETADSLIRSNQIVPIIIVGIYNTPDRTLEYSPGEKGGAYMEFVTKIVKPLIDETYRTKTGREFNVVGGSSMGGIISFMLAWEYSDIFGGAICMSPAFKINEFDYVDDVLDYTGQTKDIRFYIDNGGIGLEEQLQPGIDEMLAALETKGFKEGEDYIWVKNNKATHFEADGAIRAGEAMKMFFGKNVDEQK
ncbi:MAG: histidine kinase [Mariniphaga sp.]|nr:histidine kinase [Mariniphaga sp.]